jgi:DNA-binding MarR family transcriptional regulator
VGVAKTRWLSDDEQKTWRAFLEATHLLFERLEAQLQQEAGMPVSYYQVLVELSEAPGRALRMRDLAEATGCSRSRLSHAMARLEAAGWAERRSFPTDGRGGIAVLTPQGLAALEAAAPGHVTAVRESLFDALSPAQARELGRISQQVVDGLRPGVRCAEPDGTRARRSR